jgi:hypothetical protein
MKLGILDVDAELASTSAHLQPGRQGFVTSEVAEGAACLLTPRSVLVIAYVVGFSICALATGLQELGLFCEYGRIHG